MAGVKQKKQPGKADAGEANGQANGTVPPLAETGSSEPAQSPARRRPAARQRLKRERLTEQLERIATLASDRSIARRNKLLARTLATKPAGEKRLKHGAALLAESLGLADTVAVPADRWALSEAVAWGVAWLTKSGGSDAEAGHLLEQTAQHAETAVELIEQGDLTAAPFVLTLAGLFADVESCQPLGEAARTGVEEQIERFVGAEGGLRLDDSAEMLRNVCTWVRCREAIVSVGAQDLAQDVLRKFDLAVAFAVRLLGNNARPITEIGPGPRYGVDPLVRAASQGRKKLAATMLAMTEGRETSGRHRWSEKGLLSGSLFDEQAGVAVLRSGWKRGAVRVLVSFQAEVPHLEIQAGTSSVVAGPWELALERGGEPLSLTSSWSRSWWEADDDAVYFEISADVAGGWRIDRSVLLLREEQVVLLGDALVRPDAGYKDQPQELASPLTLQSTVTVPATLALEPCAETREVYGVDLKPRMLALPLGLGEWRQRDDQGSLESTGQHLALRQTAQVSRLYAPLWIDLNARRLKRLRERPAEEQVTWRQLTVADTREILSADQAAGFRVQAGLEQWLVYRSLDEARNRSVLGCNLSCEFLAGRLLEDGEVDRAIEVTCD